MPDPAQSGKPTVVNGEHLDPYEAGPCIGGILVVPASVVGNWIHRT